MANPSQKFIDTFERSGKLDGFFESGEIGKLSAEEFVGFLLKSTNGEALSFFDKIPEVERQSFVRLWPNIRELLVEAADGHG